MAAPDAFGWVAVPAGRAYPRWLAVKDERAVFGPGIDGLPLSEAVRRVDRWVNAQLLYMADSGGDAWASPDETLQHGAGDCEDYAILKRALLLGCGVVEDLIWFVIVRDAISRADHAVLLVATEDGDLVCDSFNALTLREGDVRDYTPTIAFQGERSWAYGRRG